MTMTADHTDRQWPNDAYVPATDNPCRRSADPAPMGVIGRRLLSRNPQAAAEFNAARARVQAGDPPRTRRPPRRRSTPR